LNIGADRQAAQMGSLPATDAGTATSTTASSLTNTGKSWTVNARSNCLVTTGGAYGIVLSNTATTLTIDRWYNPATPGGVAASTPAAGLYVIAPGAAPCAVIALSTNATAPAATDTALAGELNNPGGGLNRQLGTWMHTAGTAVYTNSSTFTANSSDGASNQVQKAALFDSMVPVTGTPQFEDLIPAPVPTLASGDIIVPTFTISI
jgi:hypothetical protein